MESKTDVAPWKLEKTGLFVTSLIIIFVQSLTTLTKACNQQKLVLEKKCLMKKILLKATNKSIFYSCKRTVYVLNREIDQNLSRPEAYPPQNKQLVTNNWIFCQSY